MRIRSFNSVLFVTVLLCLSSTTLLAQTAGAPPQNLKKFAIFGGGPFVRNLADSNASGVSIASNVGIQGGGNVGSYSFVLFSNHVSLDGDIFSNIVRMGTSNTVKGSVNVYNSSNFPYPVFTAGTLTQVSNPGNITAYGNINLDVNGTVAGRVSLPDNYAYIGPPAADTSFSPPALQPLPFTPSASEFATSGADIATTQAITPGRYGAMTLGGGNVITLSGVGDYYFRSVGNSGANSIVFDFLNNTTGVIKIFIQQDANFGSITASIKGGGDASRIYTTTNGSENATNGGIVFSVNATGNTSAKWEGSVWAPGGGIQIGNSNAGSINVVDGSLWSNTKVIIGPNTAFHYVPLSSVADVDVNPLIIPYYPPPANGKVTTLIGSELTSLYEHPTDFLNDSIIYRIIGSDVLIEVISLQGKYNDTKTFLLANGLRDTVTNGPGSLIITGKFPIANLLILNTRADLIDYVRPLYWPLTNSGLISSQGDSSMSSGAVKRLFNVTGDGVKVGVMSDSYNSIPGNFAGVDVNNGDLPGTENPDGHLDPVQVVGEYPYGTRVDEGRAMLQIVHDVAPKAKLAFRTGFISAGDFAQGIRELKTAGCKVIVDDITYITEPFLTDGIVANAVNEVVANGTSYFTAAGNFGKKSFQDLFHRTTLPTGLLGVTGVAHDFTGAGNAFQTLNLQPGNYTIVLQWDDHIYSLGTPGSGTATDLDIFLVDEGGTTLFGFNRNNIGGDPLEVLPFTVTAPTTGKLLIANANAAAGAVPFKYIVFRGSMPIAEVYGSSTIVGQANAAGANTVGAVLYSNTPPYTNPPTIASFSSRGGLLPNGVNRHKPDFTAPNGVNTSIEFGSPNIEVPADPYPNFFGTSAAAPHAAAAAALIIEAKQKFLGQAISPTDLTALIKNTAVPMANAEESGAGFVQPFAALQTFAQPKPLITSVDVPVTVTQTTTTPFNITIHGQYLKAGTKVYKGGVEVPGITIDLNTNIISATLNGAGGNPPIQLYNPPLITTNGTDGGFSDPFYLFPKHKVVVKANDQTKKYGEKLPAFTATIKVDGLEITDATAISQLGLNNIVYTTSATTASNVGNYYIKPNRTFSTTDPADIAITNNNEFTFVNGNLAISKMPLKITPKDLTLTYGQKIHNLAYNYEVGPSANIQNRDSLLLALNLVYKNTIVDSILALVNGGGGTTDTRVLVNGDFANLSVLVSGGGGTTDTRVLVNNGNGEAETTYVVDVASQAVINYVDHPDAMQQLVNGGGGTTDTRCLVNTGPLVNGNVTILGNGGGGTTDTRVLVNGDGATLNTATTGGADRTNVAVIIKGSDVPSAGGNVVHTAAINMVTRITPGDGLIIPAAFISGNYDITYGTGALKILKAPLVVKADLKYTNNGVPPAYTSTYNSFQYNDQATITHGPDYTVTPAINGAGVYTITPSNLQFTNAAYYNISYQSNSLYINPYNNGSKKVVVKLECVEQLTAPVSGMSYSAHFSYDNKNKTAVYVPIGEDNKITSAGPYVGNPPVIFLPGTGYFDILFNGAKMTYTLTTLESAHKTAVASDASSSSARCKKAGPVSPENTLLEETSVLKEGIYPNPALKQISVISNAVSGNERTINVYDALGRITRTKVVKAVAGQELELDISTLQKGMYYIRLQNGNAFKTMSFVKL